MDSIKGALILLVLFFGWAHFQSNDYASSLLKEKNQLRFEDKTPPQVTIFDGIYKWREKQNLSELVAKQSKNRPSVLHFWSTWCSKCQEKYLDFAMNHQNVKSLNSELIPIMVEEDMISIYRRQNDIQEMAKLTPIYIDENGQSFNYFKIKRLPATITLDSQGLVSQVYYEDKAFEVLEKLIKKN